LLLDDEGSIVAGHESMAIVATGRQQYRNDCFGSENHLHCNFIVVLVFMTIWQ
jgi:hypothetical protein